MKNLSPELQDRVKKEINHTKELLNKELRFSNDLRNNEMINFYESHLTKLNNIL